MTDNISELGIALVTVPDMVYATTLAVSVTTIIWGIDVRSGDVPTAVLGMDIVLTASADVIVVIKVP